MPWASDQDYGYTQPRAVGPVLLATPVLAAEPQRIEASTSWDSGILQGDGYKVIALGVTSTQPGQAAVQRYLDRAGTIAQGDPSTATLTAGTPAVVNVTDGLPYATFAVTISNTGTGPATISGFTIFLAAD